VSAEGNWSVCGSEAGEGLGFAFGLGRGGGVGVGVVAVWAVSGRLAVPLEAAVLDGAMVMVDPPQPLAAAQASTATAARRARVIMRRPRALAGNR
jgi:hypothetical protein